MKITIKPMARKLRKIDRAPLPHEEVFCYCCGCGAELNPGAYCDYDGMPGDIFVAEPEEEE